MKPILLIMMMAVMTLFFFMIFSSGITGTINFVWDFVMDILSSCDTEYIVTFDCDGSSASLAFDNIEDFHYPEDMEKIRLYFVEHGAKCDNLELRRSSLVCK